MYYCENKLKIKNGVGLGTRLLPSAMRTMTACLLACYSTCQLQYVIWLVLIVILHSTDLHVTGSKGCTHLH